MISEFVKTWFEKFKIKKNSKLYVKLIDEEYNEFKKAIEEGNFIEAVDGAVDLLWVTIGWLISSDVSADRAYKTVYAANMSKLCTSMKDAEDTVLYYRQNGVPARYESFYDEDGTYYIVYREADNKILKNINWKKPDWDWL